MNGFTFDNYGRILDAICEVGLPSYRVCDFLTCSDDLYQGRFSLLRHDVDYSPARALSGARLEAERDLRGTYYFHGPHRRRLFDVETMKEIAALGHEIGYHYETLDVCDGDFDAALRLFDEHLAAFADAVGPLKTVCAHGNPRKRKVGYEKNFDLFKNDPQLLTERGLVGEPYLSIDESRLTYVSDVGGRFAAVGDHAENLEKSVRANEIERLYILTHFGYWSHTRLRSLAVGLAGKGMRALKVNKAVVFLRRTSKTGRS